MNAYALAVLALLVFNYLLDTTSDLLNLGALKPEIPREFEGIYDASKYRQSQEYLRVRTRFGLLRSSVSLAVFLVFWLCGGFGVVDTWARSFGFGEIPTGLLFAAALSVLSSLVSLPWGIYSTFVIEERFGFNRTTWKTFVLDLLKGLLLGALLGGAVFSGLIFFFLKAGVNAWLYAWVTLTLFQLAVTFVAPVIIMPLFNKFEPLADGELKKEIERFAKSQAFRLAGIFTMDGSKRSTKTNAYFTGFGRFRRIVLFDTLVSKHSVPELVAVLAHEIGHYKKKHIVKSLVLSIGISAVLLFATGKLIGNPELFAAFRMNAPSVYASLILVSLLFSPASELLSIATHSLSRKHEFEADAYARETYGNAEALVSALKKLSVDNLSNLTPHPMTVFLEYTHPPVLKRIAALRGH